MSMTYMHCRAILSQVEKTRRFILIAFIKCHKNCHKRNVRVRYDRFNDEG